MDMDVISILFLFKNRGDWLTMELVISKNRFRYRAMDYLDFKDLGKVKVKKFRGKEKRKA